MIYGGACLNPFDNSLLLKNPYPYSLNSPLTYLESLLYVMAQIPVHSDPWLAVYWPPPSSPFPFPLPQWFPISNTCPPMTTLWYRLYTVRYSSTIPFYHFLFCYSSYWLLFHHSILPPNVILFHPTTYWSSIPSYLLLFYCYIIPLTGLPFHHTTCCSTISSYHLLVYHSIIPLAVPLFHPTTVCSPFHPTWPVVKLLKPQEILFPTVANRWGKFGSWS